MIDVNNRLICFGYGDVKVSYNHMSGIKFVGFEPPPGMSVGTLLDKECVETTDTIEISFSTIDELMDFKRLIDEIDGESNASFAYRDWMFDFSNYNRQSIIVILFYIELVERYFISLTAC